MTPAELFRLSAQGRGLADLRQVVVSDGPGTGARLIEVRTPQGLAADIALDRCGDLLRLSWRGREIGWHAATNAPHPWPDAEAEHGLGFLRGFDGFLVTCGLDHHGIPTETPAAEMNYPLRDRHVHPMHGRIATQKAEVTEKSLDWDQGEAVICLRVQQVSVFGENLELRRRYTFSLNDARVDIVDRVTNRGYRPTRHGILYHFNIGYPALDAGARLLGDQWVLRDRLDTDRAAPFDDHVEIVEAEASPDDGVIGLKCAEGPELTLQFDAAALPVTALWRAFQSGTFALGLEPQTDLADASVSRLQAGEHRDYWVALSVNG
ncbi:DUF4432 family protein [Sulfitobacter sp. D35]|uniref:DUF4432 family protein n=1 Tax=Sulfitobacter sp. D35 TaxID=3083252 RepID=UPI00296E62E2|nr:DUF4432 family protein [Sulfitobacter sp. D35]MDW4496593.1 DUF4432 family protein [Sulfitobacter sp. D35]